MKTGHVERRWLFRLCGLAFLFRVLVAALTPIPSEDGVHYLWIAQQFAAGDWRTALGEVFPPLMPLLVAPLVALSIDAYRAGQLVGALCGAAAVWPVVRATERVAPRQAFVIGVLVAVAPLAVRFAAETYSEPTFHLLIALAARAALEGRFARSGAWTGAAAWVRPEGLLLAAGCALGARRGWRALPPAALAVLLLALWRRAAGHGFEPFPKLAFHAARPDVALGTSVVAPWRLVEHLSWLPGMWLEAFQVLGLLALLGLWHGRKRRRLRFAALTIALGLALVVVFLPRRRFLLSWLPLVATFAGVGLAALPLRGRLPVTIVGVVISIVSGLRLQSTDRYGERVIGEYLGGRLAPDERVFGDMTRVLWFAGMRPLPPRHFTAEELVAGARAADVRYMVLARDRPTADPVVTALEGEFRRFAFAEKERRWAEDRGIVVLERRE